MSTSPPQNSGAASSAQCASAMPGEQRCSSSNSRGGWLDAKAALGSLTRHAFEELNLHRLKAETQTTNVASQRVLNRCGFQRYGLAPQYAKLNGSWQTIDFYQLINDMHSSSC